MDYGLGRLPAQDNRDRLYMMTALFQEPYNRDVRRIWWDGTFWANQGDTPECVEFAWHHWMAALPVNGPWKAPFWEYDDVYNEAQRLDEWPGTDYDGTSVRAGAKALQARGLITEYRWAFNLEDMIHAVYELGPVVVGTNWYRNMFYPSSDGTVRIGGPIEGGHAYLISGVNTITGKFRAKNSWGREWGRLGRFWIPFEDMERLLQEDGEACIATEVKLP